MFFELSSSSKKGKRSMTIAKRGRELRGRAPRIMVGRKALTVNSSVWRCGVRTGRVALYGALTLYSRRRFPVELTMEVGLLYFLLAILAGGLAEGAAGFGSGLVTMSLLSLVVDVPEATVSFVFASLAINVLLFSRLKEHFRWDRVLPVSISVAAGAPLGLLLLMNLDNGILMRLLGGLLVIGAIQGLLPSMAGKSLHPVLAGVPMGVASGALSAAFSLGGPPLVVYMHSQGFDRFRYVASIQLALGISGLARILVFAGSGVFDRRILLMGLAGVVPAVGGAWLGLAFLRRLPERAYRIGLGSVIGLLGLWYLFG
jgi:uncharacterized membrane protein YfcA